MFQHWLTHQWFEKKFTLFIFCLTPFAVFFQLISWLRRLCYQKKIFKSHSFNQVPVIIVGNITVGGSGKTPLLIALYFLLKNNGYKPGIISRGYGGSYRGLEWVMSDSDPKIVGDEPVLIAARTSAPVVVAKKRYQAVEALLQDTDCNIILSDDGLQHYSLARDIEIAVVDGQRGFGNHLCLPAGPLREPVSRLNSVDFLIQNGGDAGLYSGCVMNLSAVSLINLFDTNKSESLNVLDNKTIYAMAGIGNPDRFFDYLRGLGAKVIAYSFPDHHKFTKSDFDLSRIGAEKDAMIVITEKDAIKCRAFANSNMWFLPVEAKLDPVFENKFLERVRISLGDL